MADIILTVSGVRRLRGRGGGISSTINSIRNNSSKSFLSAEESDCLTEYEEDGMDTVREEDGEQEDAAGSSSAQ